MNEATKNALENMADALKPSTALREALNQMENRLAKVPEFNLPSISSPDFHLPAIDIPTQEETNAYRSASVLMKALADEALQWKQRLPKDYKPAILAVLYGGIQIHVQTLAKVSFHGIRIEGTLNGAPCSLLAHQSTIQLLCYAEEVTIQNPRNPIGFVWDDNRIEV